MRALIGRSHFCCSRSPRRRRARSRYPSATCRNPRRAPGLPRSPCAERRRCSGWSSAAPGAALVAAGADGVARDVADAAAGRRPAALLTPSPPSGTTAFAQPARLPHRAAARATRRGTCCASTSPRTRPRRSTAASGDPACQGRSDGCFPALGLRGTRGRRVAGTVARQVGVTDLADGAMRHLEGRVLGAAGDASRSSSTRPAGDRSCGVVDWRSGPTVSSACRRRPLDPAGRTRHRWTPTGTLAWAQGNSVVRGPRAGCRSSRARSRSRKRDAITRGQARRAACSPCAAPTGVDDNAAAGDRARRVRRRAASTAEDGHFGWAFDGTRLAWVAQPCAQPRDPGLGPRRASRRRAVDRRCIRARLVSRTAEAQPRGDAVQGPARPARRRPRARLRGRGRRRRLRRRPQARAEARWPSPDAAGGPTRPAWPMAPRRVRGARTRCRRAKRRQRPAGNATTTPPAAGSRVRARAASSPTAC